MPTTNFSASEFLELLRRRERAAWEALVDAYLPQLLRAGRGMGFSVDENQDLVQSVFVALMEGIGRFEGRSDRRTSAAAESLSQSFQRLLFPNADLGRVHAVHRDQLRSRVLALDRGDRDLGFEFCCVLLASVLGSHEAHRISFGRRCHVQAEISILCDCPIFGEYFTSPIEFSWER